MDFWALIPKTPPDLRKRWNKASKTMVRDTLSTFLRLTCLTVLVLCTGTLTACVTYRSGFDTLDEVQEGQSIVFGEMYLLRVNKDGEVSEEPAVDAKIKLAVIARATSEILNFDVNTRDDLFHWNLPPGRYTLAQAFFSGRTCRIYTDFEVSPDRPLSYIGTINLVFTPGGSRYRVVLEDKKLQAMGKMKDKFPELEGEPSTDLMVWRERL